MKARALAAILLVACLAGMARPADGAGRYDPRFRFRVIQTAHFTIYFHQGEARQAQRLARLAERVRTDLESRLGLVAPGRTRVVLVDQTDIANGWSTPLPYNLIEITLVSPAPHSFLGNHDDWLTMVFTHEYTHTMQIDQVGGWMRGLRWVLGRQESTFPNLFLPMWQVEGLATVEESATGLGRVHAADVAAVVGTQGRARRWPTLDQLGGGVAAWPAGSGPYFYGGVFHEALIQQRGERGLGELARQTARRLPFLGGGAFEEVYGTSANTLWREFRETSWESAEITGVRPAPSARRLTTSGFVAAGPRFVPAGDGGASTTIVYSRQTAHAFPSLRVVDVAGSADRALVTRYQGTTHSYAGSWIIYDQVEYAGAVSTVSDLFAFDRSTGQTRRLTRGARLSDPDVSADGSQLAAVNASTADKTLDVFRFVAGPDAPPRVDVTSSRRVARDGCSFATPRWSPDGRRLAAVLHCSGARPAVVLVAPATGAVDYVTPGSRARSITPAWSPDGRWLVFASDEGGTRFGVLAARVDDRATPAQWSRRLLFRPEGGATWPDISPSGHQVAYVSTTPDGLDLFVAPLPDPESCPSAPQPTQDAGSRPGGTLSAEEQVGHVADAPPLPTHAYSPWPTLAPRAWTPWLTLDGDRVDVGALVTGVDALGRHAYAALATWPIAHESVAAGFPFERRPSWSAVYSYNRWRPTVYVTASDDADTTRVLASGRLATFTAQTRTREEVIGVVFPIRRVRWYQSFLLATAFHNQVIDLPVTQIARDRNGWRAAWSFGSAREYGYSISPERGAWIGSTVEYVTPSLGADATATTTTAEARAYLPGGVRHGVLALRLAVGASRGNATVRRLFANGGPQAWSSTTSFDRRGLSLLRGFGTDTLSGTAITGLNADYRFPVAYIERGFRTWPVLVNAVHGAVFADWGAVGATLGTRTESAWSAGLEASTNLTVGHELRLTCASGIAWTHNDQRGTRPGHAATFVRVGYAF